MPAFYKPALASAVTLALTLALTPFPAALAREARSRCGQEAWRR